MKDTLIFSDDSKQRNKNDKKGDLIDRDVKNTATDYSSMDVTVTLCPNNSLPDPVPASVEGAGSGIVVDWFNALNFLRGLYQYLYILFILTDY